MEETRYVNGKTTINLDKVHLQDVDDVVTQQNEQQATRTQRTGTKLDHAREVNKKTALELKQLCEGLDSRISELGIVVATAQQYQGVEKVYSALGKFGMTWAKDKATMLRHDRIQTLTTTEAVKEIANYVKETINQLGISETEYKQDRDLYQKDLDSILGKQKEAMPKYLKVMEERQNLENEITTLDEQLKSGTLDQSQRPEVEAKFESKQRALHAAQLEETTLLSVVKEAKEALPEVQKSRDAAAEAIKSIHGMRQGILEKFNNYSIVLERATTAMKAQSRLEMYSTVDPAFNKAIESITNNNVATAGAALETMTERMKHAAIDPEASQRLLQELLGHISDAAKDMQQIESGVAQPKPSFESKSSLE